MICQGAQQDPPHPGSSTAGSVASSLCCGGRRGHHAPAQSRPSEGEIMLGDPTRWPGHWKRRSSPWVKGPASTGEGPCIDAVHTHRRSRYLRAGYGTSDAVGGVHAAATNASRRTHLCPATEPTFVDVGVVPHRPSGRGSSVVCGVSEAQQRPEVVRPHHIDSTNMDAQRGQPHGQHRQPTPRVAAQHRDQGRLQSHRTRRLRGDLLGILVASFLVKTGQDGSAA
jgi:hypothetical protein